jgi:hypothetical protein
VNVHPGKMKLTTRCVEMQTFDRHWMWRQNKVLNLEQKPPMKIIAYDSFKPGITMETIKPYLKDEVANVWRLWKAGIVRENYARADVSGVVIVFECKNIEEAKRYVDDFPLSKRGFLDWSYIPLDAPLPLEFLFDPSIDVGEPYDRTRVNRGSN